TTVYGNLEVKDSITASGVELPGGSRLNYYEQDYFFFADWAAMVGPVTNASRCEMHITRVGNTVTLHVRGVSRFDCQASAPNGNYIFASLPMPHRFRPRSSVHHLIPVTINDTTRTIGLCYISENGTFEIHPGPTRDAPSSRFAG